MSRPFIGRHSKLVEIARTITKAAGLMNVNTKSTHHGSISTSEVAL